MGISWLLQSYIFLKKRENMKKKNFRVGKFFQHSTSIYQVPAVSMSYIFFLNKHHSAHELSFTDFLAEFKKSANHPEYEVIEHERKIHESNTFLFCV